jgi:hypothetical protein
VSIATMPRVDKINFALTVFIVVLLKALSGTSLGAWLTEDKLAAVRHH